MTKVVETFTIFSYFLSGRLVTILSVRLAAESGKGSKRKPLVQLGKRPRHTPTLIANYKMMET